jgi:hypothetical protein
MSQDSAIPVASDISGSAKRFGSSGTSIDALAVSAREL